MYMPWGGGGGQEIKNTFEKIVDPNILFFSCDLNNFPNGLFVSLGWGVGTLSVRISGKHLCQPKFVSRKFVAQINL